MKTLVALFETEAMARDAMNALINAGVDRSYVRLENPDTLSEFTSTTTTTTDTTERRGFWDWLFGSDSEIPASDRDVYAESVRRGDYAVVVSSDSDDTTMIEDVLYQYNPLDVDARGEFYQSSGWTGYDRTQPIYTEDQTRTERDQYTNMSADRTVNAGDGQRLEVVEEQMNVDKRQVERGGMRIRSYVTTRPVEAQVTLREEHVTVDRRAVDRAATDADFNTNDAVIEVTEMGEEAVISKTARVVEEVVVGKEATERTETVRDSVRRKDVDVENIETTDTTYRTTGSTTDVDTTYTTTDRDQDANLTNR